MIKIVAISLLALSMSSCATYKASTRDVDRCEYAVVNPETGTIKEAIDANYKNWHINKPHCDKQFDQLGIEDENKKLFPILGL